MLDAAVTCQIAVLVQLGTEMELIVDLLGLLVVIHFFDSKVDAIEGSSDSGVNSSMYQSLRSNRRAMVVSISLKLWIIRSTRAVESVVS